MCCCPSSSPLIRQHLVIQNPLALCPILVVVSTPQTELSQKRLSVQHCPRWHGRDDKGQNQHP